MLKRQLQRKFENLKSGQGLLPEKDNNHEGESSGKSAFASPVHALYIKIPVTYTSRKKVTSLLSYVASSTNVLKSLTE